jgi:hypothetical protein
VSAGRLTLCRTILLEARMSPLYTRMVIYGFPSCSHDQRLSYEHSVSTSGWADWSCPVASS